MRGVLKQGGRAHTHVVKPSLLAANKSTDVMPLSCRKATSGSPKAVLARATPKNSPDDCQSKKKAHGQTHQTLSNSDCGLFFEMCSCTAHGLPLGKWTRAASRSPAVAQRRLGTGVSHAAWPDPPSRWTALMKGRNLGQHTATVAQGCADHRHVACTTRDSPQSTSEPGDGGGGTSKVSANVRA